VSNASCALIPAELSAHYPKAQFFFFFFFPWVSELFLLTHLWRLCVDVGFVGELERLVFLVGGDGKGFCLCFWNGGLGSC
jgi:hypothetical protein